MTIFSRREIIQGMISGAGLVVLSPTIPGCKTAQQKSVASPVPETVRQSKIDALEQFFGIDQTTATKVLSHALRNGGDFADLFFEHRITDNLKLEEQKVNLAAAKIILGAGIRVVIGDQAGYAYTDNITEKDLLKAAETASLIAHGKVQGAKLDFQTVQVPSLYPVEKIPTELPIATKMEYLRAVDRAARKASSKVDVVIAHMNNEYRRVA